MFQAIRLPVLIGLPLFLSTVVTHGRLLFAMTYGAQCVSTGRIHKALTNIVKLQ